MIVVWGGVVGGGGEGVDRGGDRRGMAPVKLDSLSPSLA